MVQERGSTALLLQTLPAPLAHLLLYAGCGKNHFLRMATLTLEILGQPQNYNNDLDPAAQSQLGPLALDFLLGAFEADPADANLARQILGLAPKLGTLTPAKRELLTHSAHNAPPPPPLLHWQQGNLAWRQEKWEESLYHFQQVGNGWITPLERAGHCLIRMQRREEGLALWRTLLHQRPWHTRLALTLYDHLEGNDTPLSGPPGPTSVLFYSWNKADDLHAALHSLEPSLDDTALVVCLNNGSTDNTADMLRYWQNRWGTRLQVEHLPVNVGAAAARNWLANLPEVRALPFAAYIDDDALLPKDWLRHLTRAVRLFPDASTWGCRIADTDDSNFLQSGPLHLIPCFSPGADAEPLPLQMIAPRDALVPEVAFSPLLAKGEPFHLSDAWSVGDEYGDSLFIRSCASVAGCCHLFRTENLADMGFSLAFSPSQDDDRQRDLLCLSKGQMACYSGFCTVRHKKRSGQGGLQGAAYGNALGNRYKLHGNFDAEEIGRMVRLEYNALTADMILRLERIDANAP